MGIFIDKKGRHINILATDSMVIAVHNDQRVGEFDYEVKEEGCDYDWKIISELHGMNIKKDYQRAGIGLEMLRIGEETFENFVYPQDGQSNYPTTEGAGLLNAAVRAGIIQIPSDDDIDYENNDYDYDPSELDFENIENMHEHPGSEERSKTVSDFRDLFSPPETETVDSKDEFFDKIFNER